MKTVRHAICGPVMHQLAFHEMFSDFYTQIFDNDCALISQSGTVNRDLLVVRYAGAITALRDP